MPEEKVDRTHWFESITSLLEQNIRGVQLGIYGIAITGLVVALRSVRPFKKFKSPKEIPVAFVEKHIKLYGKVLRIDFHPKPLLIVDHSPIIGHKFRSKGPGLPVNIESVDISANGISWLQAVVVGRSVDFTLLELHPTFVSTIVSHKSKNLGNTLVSLGFASVAPFNTNLESYGLYKKYYQSLLADELKAERSGAGIWWESTPSRPRLLHFIFNKFSALSIKFFNKLGALRIKS